MWSLTRGVSKGKVETTLPPSPPVGENSQCIEDSGTGSESILSMLNNATHAEFNEFRVKTKEKIRNILQ